MSPEPWTTTRRAVLGAGLAALLYASRPAPALAQSTLAQLEPGLFDPTPLAALETGLRSVATLAPAAPEAGLYSTGRP